MDEIDRLNDFLLRSPFHVWLGCRMVACDPESETVEILLPDRPELHRGPDGPMAHGGVVAALADLSAHAALHTRTDRIMPTIDLRIDYLRPAILPLRARARIVRNGRNIGFAEVEITGRDGATAALGRAVFFTRPPE